jgi:hypothetical protein
MSNDIEDNNHIYNTMLEVLVERETGGSLYDPRSSVSRIIRHEVGIFQEGLGLDDLRITVVSAIANIDLFNLRRSTPEDFGA